MSCIQAGVFLSDFSLRNICFNSTYLRGLNIGIGPFDSMDDKKLTKKQRKALEFRNKIEKRPKQEADKLSNKRKVSDELGDEQEGTKEESKDISEESKDISEKESAEPAKKKRKTRRGKKGKGVNGGKGPRFILFVGNLPYDVSETELLAHFKNSSPDRMRIRNDKGIAFLEFDTDTKEIQRKMELALRMHHSTMRNRKINVELTVGGGGNSETRKHKLQEKNSKLSAARKERIKQEETEQQKKHNDDDNGTDGIHPSRMNLVS